MDEEKVRLALKVSKKMVRDFENKMETAIEDEDWDRTASLRSYINGMSQIITNFELAIGEEK